MRIITLTTDFGTRDGYVAQMKGVILGIHPNATIIDATHDLEPFRVLEAAFVIRGIADHFPRGTIHVAVVDPGVGTERRGIVLQCGGSLFVGPDNGVFSFLLGDIVGNIREITNHDLMRGQVHPTFHGRDLFAPVAAHLSLGTDPADVGRVVADPVILAIPPVRTTPGGLEGEVIHVDRFGNLCTNIESGMLERTEATVVVGENAISGIARYFGEVPGGALLALVNSFGFLEIAVNRGNAAAALGLGVHAAVTVNWT